MTMKVDVVSTERALWNGEASSVVVPAAGGDLGILTGREPVLAVLRPGTVRITPTSGAPVTIDVVDGFVSVDQDVVTVVLESGNEPAALGRDEK
ncbi:F0F1 ATP synthase subunit epsilon [Georgenia yuyongxinii]|uniref:ATP synthase epsilon chain n=1 Tax=Georgenia yuyongxinii TaxID=2589797 RepID=A0A5B8C7Q0_9MICO|nr:F0F1 ATP synthase subunit epsilon [Georgenia yuyongxinii]QDC25471.1 F0F1 ATP synthase subunit epsilon [Georgenia yuyongxinii]